MLKDFICLTFKHLHIMVTFKKIKIVSGFFLLFLGMNINDWLVFTENPNTTFLTLMFFCLNFLAATQDIAVDGWALTMLRKLVFYFIVLI